jgi:hypothetical protein
MVPSAGMFSHGNTGYNSGMKCAMSLLLLAGALAAQPANSFDRAAAVRKLDSTLLTIKDGKSSDDVSAQLAADLTAMADRDHRPSAIRIKVLADELSSVLNAKNLRVDALPQITGPIFDVLQSAGTSTIGFNDAISRFEVAMRVLGVEPRRARSAADRLRAIGKEVRGPDDSPARPV